jgi:hypothetical protein
VVERVDDVFPVAYRGGDVDLAVVGKLATVGDEQGEEGFRRFVFGPSCDEPSLFGGLERRIGRIAALDGSP